MERHLELKEMHGNFNRRIILRTIIHLFLSFFSFLSFIVIKAAFNDCDVIFERFVMSRESAQNVLKASPSGLNIGTFLFRHLEKSRWHMLCAGVV
jgi:hypothetical protein